MTGSAIDARSIVARATDVIATEVDGDAIIMSIEQGHCYGFDDIGSRIWASIEQPTSVGQLCASLQQEYDVDAQSCLRDVVVLLDELVRKHIVTIRDA